jgi:2,3-bisphosphoglycerate-independent phosphoglycerate mutase
MGEILCIIDGMTDKSFRVDNYPNLRSLPLRKKTKTVPDNIQPESLTCILTLLGYQNIPQHLRGYADALGAGIPVQKEDLVLRASWVVLDIEHHILSYTQTPPDYSPGEGFIYHDLGTYKGLLVLPNMADCLDSLTTYPPHKFLGAPLASILPTGMEALRRVVIDSCQSRRYLIPWGQSRFFALPAFPKRAAVITGTNVVRGIARMTGMDIMPVLGTTGDTDTNLAAKAEAAIQAADDYPFVLLHVNGADEASHRLNLIEKQAFLRKIDRVLIPRFMDSPHAFAIISDHSTNPMTGLHDGVFQEAYTTLGFSSL